MIGLEIGTISLVGRFVGARDTDSASDSVLAGLLLGTSYALIISLISLFATPALIGVFLDSNSSSATWNLAIWGTQLNAFMMFILAWSTILSGALRGAGDTFGTMTISVVFWWFQYVLVVLLIHWIELPPDEVLVIHVFSSPLIFIALIIRFNIGDWRKFKLAG